MVSDSVSIQGNFIAPPESVAIEDSVRIAISASLTSGHIRSGALAARRAALLEREHFSGEVDEDILAEHRESATSAIFHAVAFLEAAINEEFCFNRLKIQGVADIWQQELSRTSLLDTLAKFQSYLQVSGSNPFDTGDRIYQNVDTLISLRDKLIHYKPIWMVTIPKPKQGDLPELEKKLKSLRRKIKMNPFVDSGTHFLERYLGHGCSAWAVKTAVTFADDFYVRAGLSNPYEHARSRLTTM